MKIGTSETSYFDTILTKLIDIILIGLSSSNHFSVHWPWNISDNLIFKTIELVLGWIFRCSKRIPPQYNHVRREVIPPSPLHAGFLESPTLPTSRQSDKLPLGFIIFSLHACNYSLSLPPSLSFTHTLSLSLSLCDHFKTLLGPKQSKQGAIHKHFGDFFFPKARQD